MVVEAFGIKHFLGIYPVERMNVARQLQVQNTSSASVVSGLTDTSAKPQIQANRSVDVNTQMSDQQELQQLSTIIKTWRDLNKETQQLKEQVREKTKRLKALDEMILRIMKKHNIGALDLKESGGRILYRRAQSKEGLTPKNLMGLLADHLKSEQAAADALKYINDHRGAKVRESILYEQ